MNDSLAVKKNQSSMQVLKTLKVLLQGNYTMTELITKLNEDEPQNIFNNSVISKYINTCRFCGIEIDKISNRYFVSRLPFGLKLSSNDIDLVADLQNIAINNLSKKAYKDLMSFIDKLSRFCNKHITRTTSNRNDSIKDCFEKAVLENRKIVLMLKNKELIEGAPVSITEHKNKTYIKIIQYGKEHIIPINKLSGIEILDKKFSQYDVENKPIIFEIKGDFIKRYSLREHEMVISERLPEYSIISNNGESKEFLFPRLLRYDTCCEVKEPLDCRMEMKQIINDTLANYGINE